MKRMMNESGFTLLEVAMVLFIVGIALSVMLSPLGDQRQRLKRAETDQQLADIQEVLLGYLAVNGQLPCPAINSSDGTEQRTSNVCTTQHGFLPAVTLGMVGAYSDAEALLLDTWGNPYRYSISNETAAGNGSDWDFVTAADLVSAWGGTISEGDLEICDAENCGGTFTISDAVVVVFSMGADWANGTTSGDQLENLGGTLGAYAVPGDLEFVSKTASVIAGSEFDDQLIWLSTQQVYAQLLTAGRIP